MFWAKIHRRIARRRVGIGYIDPVPTDGNSRFKWPLALAAVAVAAYIPAVNNGFIADDFVILSRLDLLKADPFYLFHTAPENFRLTSYLVFGFLKAAFGMDYRAFYIFNILLHAVNVLLLRRLVALITGAKWLALASAGLFAVFQAPQEAVTWLAAMNETLLGFFAISTLIFLTRQKYGWALAAYSCALFSKESAPILLGLIALIQAHRGKPIPRRYFLLLLPTAVFAAVFFYTLPVNFMVGRGTYALGFHAGLVLLNGLHRLFWPWAYVLIVLTRIVNGKWPPLRNVGYVAWIAVLMLPYIFVTYTKDIPSRQLYLASAVFATVLAGAVLRLNSRTLQFVFLSSFMAFNIAYLWIRKDAQMEERAAPTTALIRELKMHPPSPTLIVNFAYPYPAIAKAASLLAPGWRWENVEINRPRETCSGCLILEWAPDTRTYRTLSQSTVPVR